MTVVSRRAGATTVAALSALALTAASILGFASAAQAEYVSPEDLVRESDSPWVAETYEYVEATDSYAPPTYDECSIQFPADGGSVWYSFTEDSAPTGEAEVTAAINGFAASVTQGAGELWVLIDRDFTGDVFGISDLWIKIPVGVHGFTLDTQVNLDDGPSLGLDPNPTVQAVIDALVAEGSEFYIIEMAFDSEVASEVQWLSLNGETHWFGTNADWFTNDPSCGTVVPDDEDSVVQPTKPVAVETGIR